MRTPSPPYCRLDLAPPLADRFIFGVAPIDYGPVLLLMPFGFHLAVDTLPSGVPQAGGFRSALACFRLSLSCPFRLLHTFLLLRPARNYPRFWIWHPSFGRQRDFNPPEQRAAQHAVRPPPTPCSASFLRFRVWPLYASLPDEVASAGPSRVSPVVLMRCLCVPPPSTPSRRTGLTLAAFRSVAGFAPKGQARPEKNSS